MPPGKQPVIPSDNDVLFGRGGAIQAHPGNVAFRSLVDGRKSEFKQAHFFVKREIAMEIMQTLQQRGVRFLEDDASQKKLGAGDITSRTWVIVDEDKALKKTMHRLREKVRVPQSDRGSEGEEKSDSNSSRKPQQLSKQDGAIVGGDERVVKGSVASSVNELSNVPVQAASFLTATAGDAISAGSVMFRDEVPSNLDSLSGIQGRQGRQAGLNFSQGDLDDTLSGATERVLMGVLPRDGAERSRNSSVLQSLDHLFGASHGSPDLPHDQPAAEYHKGAETEGELYNWQLGESSMSRGMGTEPAPAALYADPCKSLHEDDNVQEGPARPDSGPACETSITLRQWIDDNIPQGLYQWDELKRYIVSAVPIAIQLTALLAEDEQSRQQKIGLRSSEIWIQIRGNSIASIDMQTSVQVGEATLMDRLALLGALLYELFSGMAPPTRNERARPDLELNGLDMDGENLQLVDHSSMLRQDDGRQAKKKTIRVSSTQYQHELVSCLDNVGLPSSISCLVKNLLDCSQSDFRVDEAYSSFEDVSTDLELVRDNPGCYLESLGNCPSFSIPNKLYGRMGAIDTIASLYASEECNCLVVNGRAGVGKSRLLSQVFTDVSRQDGSYFLQINFERAGVNPLGLIASSFNSLCEAFIRSSLPQVRSAVAVQLKSELGTVGLFALSLIVPSLSKLLQSQTTCATEQSMNIAATLRYSFCKLLEIISPHTPQIILLFDDLQFTDDSSRSIVSSLLAGAAQSAFFVCCYRDDDVKPGDAFSLWLEGLEPRGMEKIEISNLSIESVNLMVSETLKVFPRITLPLSSQLHAKTRGNPLFLRQFMESLHSQSFILLRLNPPRWTWDLEKISSVELPESVVELLIEEMQTLSRNLKNSLRVVSCIGSRVTKQTLDVLVSALGQNLTAALEDLVKRGYLVQDKSSEVRFSHDKVQESAYETMVVAEQRMLHKKLGQLMFEKVVHDETLLFLAATQINLGGIDASFDRRKRVDIATLNQKAGNRAKDMSSFDVALQFFQNGILWVPVESGWSLDYDISLALHQSAVETACLLNNVEVVTELTTNVTANARNGTDNQACLFCLVKSLATCGQLEDSKNIAFVILEQLGEVVPREKGDPGFTMDFKSMVTALKGLSDDAILSMRATHQSERDDLSLSVYLILAYIYTEISPKHIPDVALQMLRITLNNGLSAVSPQAFASFAVTLVSMGGQDGLAWRIGKLAKRLLARPHSQRYSSAVAVHLGAGVDWVFEPIQSVAESSLNGQRSGLQVGDLLNARLNYRNYLVSIYLGGKELSFCRDNFLDFLETSKKENKVLGSMYAEMCYRMSASLIEGIEYVDNLPSWDDISNKKERNIEFSYAFQAHNCMRSFLFQCYDGVMEGDSLLSRLQNTTNPPLLRPLLLLGVFYEGLLSFQLVRTHQDAKYMARGMEALQFIEKYSKTNPFTFENKYLLLEAARTELTDSDQAWIVYQKAIQSSNNHKFAHEEAIASELAGRCLFRMGMIIESHSFFTFAAGKYRSWGAKAIAQRVEVEMLQKFGEENSPMSGHHTQVDSSCLDILRGSPDHETNTSRKRSGH